MEKGKLPRPKRPGRSGKFDPAAKSSSIPPFFDQASRLRKSERIVPPTSNVVPAGSKRDAVQESSPVRGCKTTFLFSKGISTGWSGQEKSAQTAKSTQFMARKRWLWTHNVRVQPPPKAVGCDALLCGIPTRAPSTAECMLGTLSKLSRSQNQPFSSLALCHARRML